MARLLGLLALAAAAAFAFASWPLVTAVETGRTPEYPQLQPWSYPQGEEQVRRAATAAIEKLDRWTFVGSGRGPSGSEVRAIHRNPLPWFQQDVTVRIRQEGGRSRISVRSASRRAVWDLGQNTRNIDAFREALDRELVRR